MREKAWFVFEPRRVDDLVFGVCKGKWMEYEIVKTICLSKIDYENFTEDMLADRSFLEEDAPLCSTGEVFHCLLVRQRGQTGGVLAVPKGAYVLYAAAAPVGEREHEK